MIFLNRHPRAGGDPYNLSMRAGSRLWIPAFAGMTLLLLFAFVCPARADMGDEPIVKLQALDKVSAHTVAFDARVGTTVKFGSLYIKPQACRKASPLDQPESAAFLQIWEITPKTDQSHWVFSGWMFASSPALSAMDHPIYDVWVLDCVDDKTSTVALVPPLAAVPAPAKNAAAPDTSKTQPPAIAAKTPAVPAKAAMAEQPATPDDSDNDNTTDQDNDDDKAAPDTLKASPAAPPPMDATHQPVNEAPNPSSMY